MVVFYTFVAFINYCISLLITVNHCYFCRIDNLVFYLNASQQQQTVKDMHQLYTSVYFTFYLAVWLFTACFHGS